MAKDKDMQSNTNPTPAKAENTLKDSFTNPNPADNAPLADIPGDKNKDEQREYEDTYTFNNYVLEKIAGIAAREIKGILSLKGNIVSNLTGSIMDRSANPAQGVSVEVGDKDVIVRVKMILEYGAPAPQIFEELRHHMETQINTMTGLDLVELHVEVVDVMTQEEFEEAQQNRFAPANVSPKNYVNRYQDDPHYQQQGNPQQQPQQGYYNQGYQPNNPQEGYSGNF